MRINCTRTGSDLHIAHPIHPVSIHAPGPIMLATAFAWGQWLYQRSLQLNERGLTPDDELREMVFHLSDFRVIPLGPDASEILTGSDLEEDPR